MPQSSPLSVGLDGHQDSIAVASVAHDPQAEVVSRGNIGTRPCDSDHGIRRLPSKGPDLVFVYAAGPCGYGLSRDLPHQGHRCWVGAPSLIPPKPGDRVNTHRRDAITRARLRRSGDLTPVDVPTGEDDAIRELGRAREAALRARKPAQCRLTAFWLRPEIRSMGRATWGPAHLRWLRAVGCPTPAPHLVFQA